MIKVSIVTSPLHLLSSEKLRLLFNAIRDIGQYLIPTQDCKDPSSSVVILVCLTTNYCYDTSETKQCCLDLRHDFHIVICFLHAILSRTDY